DVRETLRQQNKDTSGGDFWEGKRRYVIRTLGQFKTEEQVANVILASREGAPVYVRDVAEVRLGYKKPDGLVHRYGTSVIAINALTLAGISFAVGMLVDNFIVVLESIFRHHREGDSVLTATVKGTKEVWGAIVASTLANLAVFVPVLFVQDQVGQLFRDLALAVSCSLALSLLVSLVVIS